MCLVLEKVNVIITLQVKTVVYFVKPSCLLRCRCSTLEGVGRKN